jgi:hypothetical protein
MFLLEAIFIVLFVCANMGGAQWGEKFMGMLVKVDMKKIMGLFEVLKNYEND